MSDRETSPGLPVSPADVMAIARHAGKMVVTMREGGLADVRSKSTSVDLVTEADVASERFLSQALEDLDPEIGFWGEESNQPPDQEFYWIVDPIDGTVNYASGVPFYAVSIALNRRERTLFGLVLGLPSGDLYWAKEGGGAYLIPAQAEQRQIRVNRVNRLQDALLTTGFPYHRTTHPDNNGAEFTRFLTRCQSVRSLGAAALELALVAAGLSTGHWEAWLKPWDVAAGALLVREAGGRITTYGGQAYTPANSSLIASNGQPAVHQAMVETLRTARSEVPERLFDE